MFTEFPPVPTEKWEEFIVKDLKGADYARKLVWNTIEGLKVKPYYRAEDLQHIEYLSSNLAQFPFTRGKHADNNEWDVRQDIREKDPVKANAYALDALNRGTTAIEYKSTSVDSCHAYINSTCTTWNKSIFDPYVNMLRTTIETMSAAIAGADSISTAPFDVAFKAADDFSYRIARNQQLLLKGESYLDKIVDPAAGSYYIENLTDSIAQYAWQHFLAVEEKDGFANAIREGYVQDEIAATAKQRDNEIATRRTTIIGTNQYPNLTETMNAKIEKRGDCGCHREKGTEVKTLEPYRGAEAFEHLRLATEQSGIRSKVFLLTYGNLAMRRARSGFATNFFGVAGYEIVDNNGFATAEEGVKAALEKKADIVVLCSSDDEYAEITETACNMHKGKVRSIVLAGFPKEMVETYKSYGVDEFIHVKTNVLESLTGFQKLMGIMK